MRIGELAKRTGLPRDTIRFYERNGLITSLKPEGGSNDYRDYADEMVDRLVMITEARDAGFSVKELQALLQHIENPGEERFEADPFLDRKIDDLKRTIERSQRLLHMLEATKAAIRGPH